jgi:hypothetical protein
LEFVTCVRVVFRIFRVPPTPAVGLILEAMCGFAARSTRSSWSRKPVVMKPN